MGGIVGLTQSSITSSTNEGIVDVNVVTSDSSIFSGKNYPINVGGISGGAPVDASGASGADITSCTNSGAITCVTYCKGTIPTCGGIVAHPGYEDATQTNTITRCRIPVQSAQLHLLLLALVVSLVVQVALLTVRILVQSMVTSLLRMVISVVLSVGWIRATSLSTTRAIVHCLIHVLLEQRVLQRLVALRSAR